MTIVYQNGIAGKICANPESGWKPLSEFHSQRLLGFPVGDGYKSRCRNCQQDPEHYRQIGRKSRDKHAEERNAYQREYGKANRDKLTLYTNARRARKLEAEGFHTDEEWQELKAFYNLKCLCCGQQEPDIKLTRDHVRPLTQGGTDSIDNIQPLCARCNSKKTKKHIDSR